MATGGSAATTPLGFKEADHAQAMDIFYHDVVLQGFVWDAVSYADGGVLQGREVFGRPRAVAVYLKRWRAGYVLARWQMVHFWWPEEPVRFGLPYRLVVSSRFLSTT